MKMSLFIAATMLLTSVASAQDPKYLVPFTQGQCHDRRLVVSIGDTPLEVEEGVVDFQLSKHSDSDTSMTYVSTDNGRILIVNYDADKHVKSIAYYLKMPARSSATQLAESFETMLRVFYPNKLKANDAYYKTCDDTYLVATAKSTKLAKDWYVSLTLMEVIP